MRVQLNEYNIRLGRNCYLPLATGLLRAYAEKDEVVRQHYQFSPFLYHIDSVANILKAYEQPVDVAAFSVAVWNEQLNLAVAAEVKRRWPDCLIVFGGLQVPDDATEYLHKHEFIDVTIRRAGEVAFAQVLRRYAEFEANDKPFGTIPQVTYRAMNGEVFCNAENNKFEKDLNELPSPALDGLFDYLIPLNGNQIDFSYVLETDRGCPFKCLRGDTKVNTVYGKIPIKTLAEQYKTVPVFTYSPKTRKVFVADAKAIRKYGVNEKLVRVHFQEGGHIDCTPDHQFRVFKWGNQHSDGAEWAVEAQDLKPGDRLVAVKEFKSKAGYNKLTWSRGPRATAKSRMVMRYMLGRDLARTEQVHHKNRNKSDDRPENLEYCESAKHHFANHPEISERMRLNNPAFEMTPEWVEKIRTSITGLKRSAESKQRYRESKLGAKNPNFERNPRTCIGCGTVFYRKKGRNPITKYCSAECSWARRHEIARQAQANRVRNADGTFNHKVSYVEVLTERDDVYCLTVPATGWFFAEDVLIRNCSFCEYGLGQHKLSYYEMDRVFGEIEWMGRNKIEYCLGAAANFGMVKRDMEIAEYLVATKKKYGYPDKFRVNYAKNTGDKIYNVGLLLHEADMTKSITLARQSNDPKVLKNIKRENIKMSTYQELQVRFNDIGVPTYSEFIMGLPGETYESWKHGLDEVVAAGMKNQVLVYPCMALPNTDMGRPWYQQQFSIQTRRIEMAEVHGTRRDAELVPEYEEIVVATASLSVEEWRQTAIFSWIFGALHSLKLGYFIIIYLLDRHGIKASELIQFIMDEAAQGRAGGVWQREFEAYNATLDGVLNDGQPMATLLPEYGDVYWSGEEASFLRIAGVSAEQLDDFYAVDMTYLLIKLLQAKGVQWDLAELFDVIDYQALRMPVLDPQLDTDLAFGSNLHTYFESAFTSAPVALKKERQRVRVRPTDFRGDKRQFAREIVLFGRKSNKILTPASVI